MAAAVLRGPAAAALLLAQAAALYADKPRARLVYCRRAGGAVVALLALPDGTLKHLRVTAVDCAELGALTESERARVRGAVMSLAAEVHS